MIEAAKDFIRDATGLPDPLLHVLIGLTLYLICVVAFGRSFRSWLPLIALLLIELLNESFDAAQDLASWGDISIRGTALDVTLTIILPLLIVVTARRLSGPPSATR